MPFDLALLDLVAPYVLLGRNLGPAHAALSTIFVSEYEIAVDTGGVVIRGVARFSGFIDPTRGVIGNVEGHPQNDPGRRDPWIDIRDSRVEFQLTVPRVASQIINTAITTLTTPPPAAGSPIAALATVFTALDNIPADAPPSDFPSTAFTLDLLINAAVLRPPFLRGAKRLPEGLLAPDPQHTEVTFTLPRFKLRLAQGSAVGSTLDIVLLSAGAHSLDDPSGLGVAELVTMDPPYAFIGPTNVVGFGFRGAVLDLSAGATPADVLSQFGYDESWTGLYLPEVRLFLAPPGMNDFAFDGGARNLLIGFGATPGITGDFDLSLLDQGDPLLRLSARFFDATGRTYGITRSGNTTTTFVPPLTRMVVDIDGGRSPYFPKVSIDGASAPDSRLIEIDLTTVARRTVTISVTDSRPDLPPTLLTITVNRQPAASLPPGGTVGTGGTAGTMPIVPPEVKNITITSGGSLALAPTMRLVTYTDDTATLELDPPDPNTQWTVNGTSTSTGPRVLVKSLGPGQSAEVVGTRASTSISGPLDCYFHFDQPKDTLGDAQVRDYGRNLANTHSQPSVDQTPASTWTGGTDFITENLETLRQLPVGAIVTVQGEASRERTPTTGDYEYNRLLAQRRANALDALIEDAIITHQLNAFQVVVGSDQSMADWSGHGEPRNQWWRARATFPAVVRPSTETRGTVSRPVTRPLPPPGNFPVLDPPPQAPPSPPSWFRSLSGKVRIVRDTFVAAQVDSKIDFETAVEERLRTGPHPLNKEEVQQLRRAGMNPADGIVDFRILIQVDDATGNTTVVGSLGADPADRDGLWMSGWLEGEERPDGRPPLARNVLGMYALFTPLLSSLVTTSPADIARGLVPVVLDTAALAIPLGLALLPQPQLNIERVIWYGGELAVHLRNTGPEVTLLLDVETALSAKVDIGGMRLIEISEQNPLTVRYKAIGLKLGYSPDEPRGQFLPMFDASKGYTIDVSRPGTVKVVEPLGQILQVLAARIARTNPLHLEVELGFSVDLGVVSVDKARVRLPLDPVGTPELTALAMGVDIPGTLRGTGSLSLSEKEIKGQLDLTLLPVKLRVAASVSIANIPAAEGGPATGVMVTLDVDFPTAIPLAGSGLGIYGFVGLFAMHYARDESGISAGNTAPALAWLKATGGNPSGIDFWKPAVNRWAFGVGARLGTLGSSVVFNLKGMFMLELPGPRLLLMMKAQLLQPMPELKSDAEGNLLAVIDLDTARGTLTIGIVADYTVDPLLKLRIPVEAFFNFKQAKDWHVYIGRYDEPIQAKVLEVFDGSGYLMVSGNGIPAHGGLPEVSGFSVGMGLRTALLWGSTSAGLYLRVTAGFDAVVGFEPFHVAGILFISGELHLFILGIEASAKLTVEVGTTTDDKKVSLIDGEVYGRISLFFFDLEGSVSFHLGETTVPSAEPPKLVQVGKLVSRSPALVVGTAVDKPVDAGIGDMKQGATQPEKLPVVPIDAIPVLMMSAPPTDDGLLVFGASPGGSPGAPSDGWVQRGDDWFHYSLTAVTLKGGVSAGKTPATWWTQLAPTDKNFNAQLALLSWVPTPTPKAIENSEFLEDTLRDRWETVCHASAPPTPVMWTFREELLGPSPTGWELDGEAWPDPPKTVRSSPPYRRLKVTERWRCGDPRIDQLRGIIPAVVEGNTVPCPRERRSTGFSSRPPTFTAVDQPVAGRMGITPLPVVESLAPRTGGKTVEDLTLEPLGLAEVARRSLLGLSVSRATLASLAGSPITSVAAPAATSPGPVCPSRVLASPMLDDGRVIAFGPESQAERVKAAWDTLKYRSGELGNAVVFHTGAVKYARFLLIVRRDLLERKALVLRQLDASGKTVSERPVTSADLLLSAPLPPQWTDSSVGPWFDDVELAARYLSDTALKQGYVAVFVELKGGPASEHIELGVVKPWEHLSRKSVVRPYYVAVLEALRASEVSRHDADSHTVGRNQGVLNSALGPESADCALLLPDTVYSLEVTWNVERGKRTRPEDPVTKMGGPTSDTQTFWFRTDDQPPQRLDPWLLCTLPADFEQVVFGGEPVRLVFGTNDVARLYDTYGQRLEVRLKAASFHHPEPTLDAPHPFPLDDGTLHTLKAQVLSPWEETVVKVVKGAGDCVDVTEDRVRHCMVTMPIPLDPLTDYVMDVEYVPKSATAGTVGTRVLRRSFTTSAFRTLEAFAQSFQAARVQHRYARPGALQAVGATFATRSPQGAELDEALVKAGLEPMPVPKHPRVVVFWEQANPASPPAPAAVLVDATESMWRGRPYPQKVMDPSPSTAFRWELVPRDWLVLEESGTAVVDRIVRAPGGQRALVTLKPSSRGKDLKLVLRRKAQKEEYLDGPAAKDEVRAIAEIALSRAPWEED